MTTPMRSASVILPAHDEGDNLVDTVDCVLRHSGDVALEVIIADDGSTDGSPERARARFGPDRVTVVRGEGLGVARARNLGAAAATGEALVFLDAHCYVPDGWLAPLLEILAGARAGMAGPAFSNIHDPRMRACGITWQDAGLENVWLPVTAGPGHVPFHIGACQAVRADAFRDVGGYDEGMTRWGHEDIELCLRFWLFGYEVFAQPASLVYHLFRQRHPYAVDGRQVLYNRLRLMLLHFDADRLERGLAHLLPYQELSWGLARAYADGTTRCREANFARRHRDMDWFCASFGMAI